MHNFNSKSPVSGQFWVEGVSPSFYRLNSATGERKNYRDLLLWRRDENGNHQVSARMLTTGCEGIRVGDKVDVDLKFKVKLDRKGQMHNHVFISRLKKVEENEKEMFHA